VTADWSAKFMTKKNNGIYEPEFRILLVIPQFVFGCTGLFLFGVTSARIFHYSWLLPVVGFGFEVGGMVIGAVAASLYIVDAHRDLAIESFTCILIFKVCLLAHFSSLPNWHVPELLLFRPHMECVRLDCPFRDLQDIHVGLQYSGHNLPPEYSYV